MNYGAIPRADADNVQAADADDNRAAGGGEVNFCLRSLQHFLQGPAGIAEGANTISFRVNPESCRFIAYVFFWWMCGFAYLMTKFVTGPQLAQGPIEPGNTCPPFNGNKSHGFDVETDSHLKDAFGFNNVRVM